MLDTDTCVCCGAPIPEGRMICAACECDTSMSKNENEEFLENLSESLVPKDEK